MSFFFDAYVLQYLLQVAEYQGLSELKQNGTAFEGSQMAKYHEHN